MVEQYLHKVEVCGSDPHPSHMTKAKKFFLGLGIFWLLFLLGLGYLLDVPTVVKIYFAEKKLNKLNFCSQSSDCYYFGYNNGCSFAPINSSTVNQAEKITQNIDGSLMCDYFGTKEFTCENQKCIPHEASFLN